MTRRIRRLIVSALTAHCRLHRHRLSWLCIKGACLSDRLDQKWGTGVWTRSIPTKDEL